MTFLIGEINMPRVRKVKKSNSKNHMVWRIAVYIRLSKDDGNDESLSVTNQKKIIREYLENFFEEEYILVDIYIDDGISGTTDDARTEFIRMIDDVKAGLVNCIICKTLARTFRIMQIKVIIWKNFFHFITQDLSVWEVRHLTLTKIQSRLQTVWTFRLRD